MVKTNSLGKLTHPTPTNKVVVSVPGKTSPGVQHTGIPIPPQSPTGSKK